MRSGRTVLAVESTPPGARITLDGRPIGATNAMFNTFPGAHVVIVDKAGYRPETRTAITEEGKTASVAITLVPRTAGVVVARPRPWFMGGLIAGGVSAVVLGGALLELGARGGPNDKYRYVGATPAGAVIGAAGGAALVTGIYLWWRAPAPSTPAVGMASGGSAVAGWGAAF